MTTHLLAYAGDYRGSLRRALCGELIDVETEHAIGPPECEACQRIDDEDCATLLALRQIPPPPPPLPRGLSPRRRVR